MRQVLVISNHTFFYYYLAANLIYLLLLVTAGVFQHNLPEAAGRHLDRAQQGLPAAE